MAIFLALTPIAIALAIEALRRTPAGIPRAEENGKAGGTVWTIFALLAVAHVLIAYLMLHPGPRPNIDVYTFQKTACDNLTRWIDPFGATQADPYDARGSSLFFAQGLIRNGRVLEGFQYPPLTLAWILPGYLLGDLRASYVLAVLAAAAILLALRPDRRGLWIAGVALLNPLTFVVEFCSFTEPLVYMTLCATVYAAVKRRWWLPIAFGLFLASKQYNVLALPLAVYLLPRFRWRECAQLLGWSLLTAGATVLPFAVWNLRAFWHDLVLFNLMPPNRSDALSFVVPFPWIIRFGPVLVLAFIMWALLATNRSPAAFPTAYSTALLVLFATSRQAFANYFYLAGMAFLLSAAMLAAGGGGEKAAPRPSA